MAGSKLESQEVVAHVVVEGRVENRCVPPLLVTEILVLAFESLVSAQEIDHTMLGGCHEPGGRVVRDASLRPLLWRGDESIRSEFPGQTGLADSILQTAPITPPSIRRCKLNQCVRMRMVSASVEPRAPWSIPR